MKTTKLFLACLLVVGSASAQFQKETSFETHGLGRALQYEGVVNGDAAAVWTSLTTAEGLRATIAPVAYIELKTGGKWQTHMNPAAKIGDRGTIQNEILSFVPNRMLSMKVGLPPVFAEEVRAANSLFAVISLTPVGKDRTRVTITMLGFGTGPGWDVAYRIFKECVQDTLVAMQQRFKSGPIDWIKRNPYVKHNHAPVVQASSKEHPHE